MRELAAVIALVMAVLDRGPARCPCQLQARLLPAAGTKVGYRAATNKEAGHGCPCKGHRSHSEVTCTPTPRPDTPHCPHCPAIDLAPPTSPGERTQGQGPVEYLAAAECVSPADLLAPAEAQARGAPFLGSGASPAERLRFCCGFRC
jgi:hypothetical protein